MKSKHSLPSPNPRSPPETSAFGTITIGVKTFSFMDKHGLSFVLILGKSKTITVLKISLLEAMPRRQALFRGIAYNCLMDFWQQITQNITQQLKASGKTKTQISKEVGVTVTTLCQYVSGRAFPNYQTLKKLCISLDCTYEDILGQL